MMKWTMALVLAIAVMCGLTAACTAQQSEMVYVEARDGYTLEGKLDVPQGEVGRVVVYVNGSGPNTYDNRRGASAQDTFNYYDVFAEQLCEKGVAFFRASARGCTMGEEPPQFVNIDEDAYQTYVPENSIADVEDIVRALKADERFQVAEIYLLGWSEGTMIATHVAQRANVPIDALLLCGYVNDTMAEVLAWQQTGGSSMVFYCQYFDNDGDGRVARDEFESDPYGVIPLMGGITFDQLDANNDGALTRTDFEMMLASGWEQLKGAIERGDDAWLKENYPVALTGAWFRGHEELTPNRDVVPALDLPIEIFHGALDANAPVEGVYAIEAAMKALGKDNLRVHVYPDSDHDLNYAVYLTHGVLPEAFTELFARCTED